MKNIVKKVMNCIWYYICVTLGVLAILLLLAEEPEAWMLALAVIAMLYGQYRIGNRRKLMRLKKERKQQKELNELFSLIVLLADERQQMLDDPYFIEEVCDEIHMHYTKYEKVTGVDVKSALARKLLAQ